MTEAMDAVDRKQCKQCKETKDVKHFRKVVNKYTSVHYMSICRDCYNRNQEELRQRQKAEWEAGKEKREAFHRLQEKRQKWEERREERERQQEQEQQARQQALDAWYQQQPDRQCIDCNKKLPASAFGYSTISEVEGVWLPDSLRRRCDPCHEAYRKGNRQVYPLCSLCGAPTSVYDFLREYRGFRLDIIKVCCTSCIPRFDALPESEQMELLRRAIVKAYGETASIYGLHYDESGAVHHIGRTKHLQRRLAEYRRNWYREITTHDILQELPFGGLSMEYESRWMLHALKQGWPIDNFDVFEPEGPSYEKMQLTKAELTSAVADLEPLIVPFETIKPLLVRFSNTGDIPIVHWFLETSGELNRVLEAITGDDRPLIRP